jgi:putative ABC transport system ATP-binding protein
MIRIEEVSRRYADTPALDGVSLSIDAGEFVAITGPSGCGKSTLLNLMGGLDQPDSGRIFADGIALHAADERALTEYRRRRLGIVFQFFNLLPGLTVAENVEIPLLLAGVAAGVMRARALECIEMVGLSHRATGFPHQLSGGEMQRAAIARALVHEPAILLADEPTGNLDSSNAAQVVESLLKIASQRLVTMVVVTHSEDVAATARRQVQMLDGKIASHG